MPKPVTIKSSQQKMKNVGMNDPTVPQYGPINQNRIPVGSDTYNGNGYYWPSGYNQMYGSQNYPRNYGRFQSGAQYPYDPRYYNSYDNAGQQMGSGYIDPARGYYDKLAPGSGSQASGSQTGPDIGKGKSSKIDHSGVKYPNGNVMSNSNGRDGTPVKSINDKSVSNLEEKHVVKTTEKPTTHRPTTQPAITRERFNSWRNEKAGWEKTNHHVSDKSSQKQINHDIPSWKSQEGTKKFAQENRNNWEKEQDLSRNDKYNQFKDNSDQSVGTPEHGTSNNVNTHHPRPGESSADKSHTAKQNAPIPQHGTGKEKSWGQHTESQMDNNYSSASSKKGTSGNHREDSKGRMSDVSPGQGRSGGDGSLGQGRSGSGESRDRTSNRHRGQGKSDRWQQQQRWKDGRNKEIGQTNDRQMGQANTNNRIQKQDRTQVGSKVKTSDDSHRKPNIIDHGSNRLSDNSGKSMKGKQKEKGESESIDYDSYFNKSPQTGQDVGPQKPGYRRPAYKKQRPHHYQYYDSYRPSPYWNYDYYEYSDHPNKKYPPPYDQGDSGTGCCLAVVKSVVVLSGVLSKVL